ncbi:MAG: CRISP-associated protein Cas1 [Thermotogota bacterium]|jgi:CRISPR-associated protein Cas1|nr:MAG: CRISPR-associated endonuclease Cas1 [bacterium 42_11]MDK2864853.1 CRISP-associated protein Cas1 [Thermotogota bacterium]HCZ07029.1 hypothetical protein [Thermotogota bacterium]
MKLEEIPIYAINAYLYCPYRFYIEHVKGEFEDNDHTVEGRFISQQENTKGQTKNWKKRPQIFVQSEHYGIFGFVDQVIENKEKTKIIEIKKGDASHPYLNDVMQLTAYMLAYAESYNKKIETMEGEIRYVGSNKKFKITPTRKRVSKLLEILQSMRAVAEDPPQPSYSKKKCDPCSLINICLPQKENALKRKIMPSSRDAHPLYIATQGAYIRQSGESVTVNCNGRNIVKIHYSKISALHLMGNVQISTQAMKLLTSNSIPVVFSDILGRYWFVCHSGFSKNIPLRIKQLQLTQDEKKKIEISKRIIEGKIKNQLYVLKKKNLTTKQDSRAILSMLKDLDRCKSIDELMGIEGQVASLYFDKISKKLDPKWEFNGRNRRPSKDPINALLSFGYSILHNVVLSAIMATGLDPFIGVLHKEHYGRTSLALDIMEEFRPIIIDLEVLSMINLGQLKKNDFSENIGGAIFLTDKGRKKFLEVIRKRLETKRYYSLLDSRVEYIRIIEAQVRVFEKCILGEINTYTPFVVER